MAEAEGRRAEGSALELLLSAPSRQAVDEFLCACAAECEQPDAPTPSRLLALAGAFGLAPAEARRLHSAAVRCVRAAALSAGPQTDVDALFPDGFQPQLKALIMRVIDHRREEWRAESLRRGGISSCPRLLSSSYQVYRAPSAQPTLLLGLDLDRSAGHSPSAGEPRVHVELSAEQLDVMLAGLAKIKDQARPPPPHAARLSSHCGGALVAQLAQV
ncbi:hypothetical protein AB1Y20_008872 [Prymnesium parvum]|uniref:COMM domain-containing protein n=1 Tax=Prymnesium parvum TaxID=97485 RepID=A0AB34IUD2_PRYPA